MIGKKELKNLVEYFSKTLEQLRKLNSFCDKPIISSKEFKEQYDNINDLKKLFSDYVVILRKLKKVNKEDDVAVDKILAELHRILTTLGWHVSELHEINLKIFKEYSSRKKTKR